MEQDLTESQEIRQSGKQEAIMKMKKFAAMMLAGVLATTTMGMGVSASDDDYDFYFFNIKGEDADAMQAAVDAYKEETGVTIKLFTLGSGTDSSEALRADLQSDHMPAIFGVQDAQKLVEYQEGGYAMPLSDATNEEFKALADAIPENFYLTRDGETNYGVPLNIEGYGYIVDTRVIGAMFGEDNTDAFIEAYKTASYAEFEAMINAMQQYITDGTADDITLSGSTFSFAEKNDITSKLKGVIAVAGSEKWTYGDHLVNVAVDGVFSDSVAAAEATTEQLEAGKPVWEAYAKLLDLLTSHAQTERGPELINQTTNGYDQAVASFANGETVFIKQGNWCYTNITNANADIADYMTFLPIKLDVTDEDLTSGITAEQMNTSIPVFVPQYYCINAKCSDEEKEAAEKFLVWLNTSETGLKYVIEECAFIPYNADPDVTSAGYSLGDSILSYVKEGKTITNAYAGMPASYATYTLGAHLLENYVNTAEWPETAYSDIADFIVSSWSEAAGL